MCSHEEVARLRICEYMCIYPCVIRRLVSSPNKKKSEMSNNSNLLLVAGFHLN